MIAPDVAPRDLPAHYKEVRNRLRGHVPPRVAPVKFEPAPPIEPIIIQGRFGLAAFFNGEPIAPLQCQTVRRIVQEVCNHFKVFHSDIVSKRRTADVVLPRQVAMYLARELTPLSFPSIGRHLAYRDHTTIMHGYQKIARLIESDPAIRDAVVAIKARCVA